ncbi:MAG: SGNH/GDSL hydrolase family protein [Thermoanaerobaculia bacterium]|nr:SGNH/GDSL hydrolase family protein [Thermoanaerobaculia bacterium]
MKRRLRLAAIFVWSGALAAALVFLALQGRRKLFLVLDVESHQGAPVVGQVWWTSALRPFNPSDSTSFRLAPGRQTISIRLPVEVDTIQVKPGLPPASKLTLSSIALETSVSTLRRWDASAGFGGLRQTGGMGSDRTKDGLLVMTAAGPDGAFQVDDVGPLRDAARRMAHLRVALALGVLLGALQTLGIARLLQGQRSMQASGEFAPRGAAPKGAWLLFSSTTVVCLTAAWFIARALLHRETPPVFTDTGEYSLVFVDHLGNRLSERDGSLRLALDANAFYRNAPNQLTSLFRIDAHGYRGGSDGADARPGVLFLGGSVAFGFGLAADAEVFSARIAELESGSRVVNAAVVGYLSGQELSELVHHAPEVAPAAVVVLDGWNDLYVPLLAATRFPAAGLGVGFNWDVFHMVENRLRLFTLGGAPEPPSPERQEPVPDLVRRITAAYRTNLREMNRYCLSRGIPFLVALQPWTASRRAPRPESEEKALAGWIGIGTRADPALYDAFVAEVRRSSEADRIPLVDLHASGPFVGSTEPLFLDVVHPNAAGHRLIAAEIDARLRPLLKPPAATPPPGRTVGENR